MRTAVDSSVLFAIFKGEPTARGWLDCLVDARRAGQLVICGVVYAEVAPMFVAAGQFEDALRRLGIRFDLLGVEAAWHAGTIYGAYRAAGGRREHLIPDFLIAAHALKQADRLAAADRGYLRRYFDDLDLLSPG